MCSNKSPFQTSLVIALFLCAGSSRAEDWSPLWTTATLSQPRYLLSAASAGGKAYFAGGYSDGSVQSAVVDVYDLNAGTWSTMNLPNARHSFVAASANDNVVFGGGSSTATVDIYNTASNTWSAASLSQRRSYLAAASSAGKVVFAGGYAFGQIPYPYSSAVVDIYDTVNNTWATSSLSQPRYNLAAASVGSEMFFAGGEGYGSFPSTTARVDIFNVDANTWSTATLSQARYRFAAATVGTKVLFGGGWAGPALPSNRVDIYDSATQSWSTASLSQGRQDLAAASVGDRVLFAGGHLGSGVLSKVVDIYNSTTNTWSTGTLSQARDQLAATAVGNKVIFAGGVSKWQTVVSEISNSVDIYTYQSYDAITSARVFTLVDHTTVAGRMHLNAEASLNLDTYNLNIGSMSGAGPIDLCNRTLTVGSDNTSSTYSGSISGGGTLVKTGDAALTLTGSNSYSGPTTVDAGALLVNGAGSLTSPVTVNAGAAFGGNGRAGSVTVKAEGHVAPGASASALRLAGNLTLEAGAKLDFELGPPAFSDLIAMDSATTLFLNGQQFSDFTFTTYTGFEPGEYTLIDAFAIEGALGTNRNGTIAGLPASLAVSGSALVLTVVPEPSTLALLVIGMVGVLAYARRRRWRRV
jgi:kelch-like protein 20